MNLRKHLLIVFLVTLLLNNSSLFSQSIEDTLTTTTPFTKGRWITGLSGSISSGSNTLNSSEDGLNINQYTIDYRTGQFAKDRLLVGGILSLSRSNLSDVNSRTLETFYAGPLVSWYLSNDEQGSLFVSGAGVFSLFRDETHSENIPELGQVIDGIGGGMILRLGYSYVLHKKVTFDLSLNYSKMWLSNERTEDITSLSSRDNFAVTDLSFSFGFNIILDHFFF